jgi:hypothetical protein
MLEFKCHKLQIFSYTYIQARFSSKILSTHAVMANLLSFDK